MSSRESVEDFSLQCLGRSLLSYNCMLQFLVVNDQAS